MSLFIADLAFGDAALFASAKIGILSASLVTGTIGYLILRPPHCIAYSVVGDFQDGKPLTTVE